MKKAALIIFMALSIISCSNAEDRVFSKDDLNEDMQALKDDGMSEEDRKIIAGTVVGSAFSGESLDGKTYGEILLDAKKRIARRDSIEEVERIKQEALAAEIEKERVERENRMRQTLTVSITGKKVIPENYDVGRYSSVNAFSYAIQNRQDVPIEAVKFEFTLTNTLGDKIGSTYVVSSTDRTIPGNDKISDEAWFEINQFDDDDLAAAAEDFNKLDFNINILKVVLSDGTVLE